LFKPNNKLQKTEAEKQLCRGKFGQLKWLKNPNQNKNRTQKGRNN